MKTFQMIKYPAAALLLAVAFLFAGEQYRQTLPLMPTDYWGCLVELPEGTDPAAVWEAAEAAAAAENAAVIFTGNTVSDNGHYTLTLYGTANAPAILQADYGLREGVYPSLLAGPLTVQFRALTDIDDPLVLRQCTLSGDEATVRRLQARLQPVGFSHLTNQKADVYRGGALGCWVLVLSLLLLLTLYELALAKKEVLLRTVSGERLARQVGGAMGLDLAVFGGLFLALGLLLNLVTCALAYIRPILLVFGGFLLIDLLLHLWLFVTDYKRDIATNHAAHRVLQFSYLYKTVTAVLCMLTMAGSVTLLWNNRDMLSQRAFFREQEDWSFVTLSDPVYDKHEQINRTFYTHLNEAGRVLVLQDRGLLEDSESHLLIASQTAEGYLAKVIPSLKDALAAAKDTPLLLVPEGFHDEAALGYVRELYGSVLTPIPYPTPARLVGITGAGSVDSIESALLHDPVIVLDRSGTWRAGWETCAMVRISDGEWADFVAEETPHTHVRVSVLEQYAERTRTQTRACLLACGALLLFLLLEGFIIKTMLLCEYRVRAVEITLKRLHGYPLLRRYATPLLTTLCSSAVGLLAAAVLCRFWDAPLPQVMAVGALLTLVEWGLMIAAVCRMERRQLANVLKGGTL